MALFQSSVLKDHLRLQDEQQVEKAYKKFTAFFHNHEIQENIRSSKEEQFQATFLSELFVKVLGYTMNPQPGYELTTEFKNQKNARKADGAILKDGLAIGVIELKGTNTKHLEGIRQQAFDYKANQKGCVYVITSNFEKLRFYINDATEFVEFDLFELNRKDFSLLYLCLHKDNIFSHRPLKIKEASLVEEEVITRQFYKDYSVFKRELFRDLVLRNVDRIKNERPPGYESEAKNPEAETKKQIRLNLFKKSQKLIDRFLFIFFAEDRGLLPPNSIHRIIDDWNKLKDLDAETPLYKRFQLYFSYLDTGRKGTDKKAEIFAYNGGLFKPDPILDMIVIDDDLLYKHTARLATYDFESQVDVNILGHIFENSLNEIESVNAEIEGADFDKQKSKRKKEGVFYTPKYITKYIVENTLGRLCEEKKNELGFREEEYYKGRKRRQKETLEGLIKILDDYRDWLLKLTICDPACGSGAFLNQALDFLIKEHRYIDELKHKLLGGGLVFSDIETTILENNIYGVDINEESVEIAKLSLWLRTAQPRRKLNDLSSNIKCGNSLIDDKKVAGNKAFKWEEEFPDVFNPSSGSGGGFDVVIGNPPYVKVQFLSHQQIDWFKKNKEVAHKRIDISLIFFELAQKILRQKGAVSFITSNQFLSSEYGRKCRELLRYKFRIEKIIDFKDLPVFEGALTYVSIFCLRKGVPEDFVLYEVESVIKAQQSDYGKRTYVDVNSLNTDTWSLKNTKTEFLLKKLNSFQTLDKFGSCNYGMVSGNDSIFLIDDELKLELKLEEEILLPLLRAENCARNVIVSFSNYIIYPYVSRDGKTELMEEKELELKFPNTYKYLIANKKLLELRKDSRRTLKGSKDWYKLTRFGSLQLFLKDKIVYPGETKHNKFGLDFNSAGYSGARVFSITLNDQENPLDLYGLLGVLNSQLIEFYLHAIAPLKQGGYYSYSSTILNKLPLSKGKNIINISSNSKTIVELNMSLLSFKNRFLGFFSSSLSLTKLSVKLQSWHELEFGDFIKELNKAIKAGNKVRAKEAAAAVASGSGGVPSSAVEMPQLTKKDEFEWMELFEENKKKAVELQQQIVATDREIDRMVYELYGLTEEEIGIVEGSL